ncbi:metallophosphoesterase [Synechococcus sp. RSCCF101]|uniref:metallophosphoesterase family protein n=1 Tax=Synechococcus sp. RSCCF101 TaxID=2511069 RepID=UPI001245C4CB|nr:metallophosphoesterase family protein [Synechococcus sp. RSCCF101]QEY33001.1 metallophosphoesterase [Synechococcus sp. RSCCF101]
MPHAVISCLHANLAAVEAVLADIDRLGIDTITCLGDLVGYGPQPNEVVELVRERGIPSCQGCWDEDIIEGLNACECSYPSQLAERRGHLAHHWTAAQLTDENKDFLASLPTSLRRDRSLFVHGSPNSQHEYLLPDMDAFAALERVETAGADTLFCGHTHRPYVRDLSNGSIRVRVRGPQGSSQPQQERQMQLPMRRIINAGSVGEPRHGSTRATYVVHDAESGAVDIRDVPYDVERTCQAILEAGLPPIFAWRLSHGFEYAERADDASHVCER